MIERRDGGEAVVGHPVVDMRCFCKDCTSRTLESYGLVAQCTNCRSYFRALIRKGDRPKPSAECPACGVSYRWSFGGLIP